LNAMQKIATVISKIGWDKKLSDLKEEEILAIMLHTDKEGLSDVYLEQNLTDIYFDYKTY